MRLPVLIVAAALLTLSVHAQNTPPPPPAPANGDPSDPTPAPTDDVMARRLHFLTRKLQLTPEQQDKILPILTQESKKLDAVFSHVSLDRDDKLAEKYREEARDRISPLLDPDQRRVFSNIRRYRDWLP